MTNTGPLVYYVRKRLLGFLGHVGHVLHLPEEAPARRHAFYVPPHGKGKPGRPRTSYFAYDYEIEISADEKATLAEGGCAWKNLVIACSAAEG